LCYRLQTLAVGRMTQKMGFAPCCCRGRKNDFFSGKGAQPLPRTPPPRRLAAPPSEILNTPLLAVIV